MKRYLIEIIIIVIISASYGFAAYQRNFVWKNDFSLRSDVITKSSDKARPYMHAIQPKEKGTFFVPFSS